MSIYKLLLLVSYCISMVAYANAQDNMSTKCMYAQEPCWIRMMDDPSANYFETLKAFDEFWKARGGEPFYSENLEERNRYEQQKRSSNEKKAEEEKQKYLMEYKRFLIWRKQVEPFVQPDGTILSPQEQQQLNQEQRK